MVVGVGLAFSWCDHSRALDPPMTLFGWRITWMLACRPDKCAYACTPTHFHVSLGDPGDRCATSRTHLPGGVGQCQLDLVVEDDVHPHALLGLMTSRDRCGVSYRKCCQAGCGGAP